MRIIELLIDKLEELSGFDAVALVEEPAIEADFMAFNNNEILNTIEFEVLKLAMKEQFVERRAGEGRDEYIARCIPVLKDEGYGDDQAAAICYQALKLYEHEDDHNYEHKTLYVSVIKTDDGKKYVIDDTLLPELHLEIGKKYCIDQCDESNMEHPMRLSTTPDGIHNGGQMYRGEGVDEIEYELDKIHFTPNQNTPKELFYYCENHPGMGGVFKIVEKEEELDIDVSSLPQYTNNLDDKYEFETYNDYPQSAVNAAKRALEWKNEHPDNDCGTRVGWARANQLANRRNISEDTIARMASFARHAQHKDVPYSEGCGGLMWDAWGGTAGIEWASNKLERIRASKQSLKKSNVLLTKDKLELLERQSDLNNTARFKFGINEEQMKVIGAMLIPDKLILRIDEEGNPYYVYFSKETVKAIAEKAMKNKLIDVVNLEHNQDQEIDAFMTQSWIVEDSAKDKSALYGMDLPEGTWAAEYKIEDDKVWQDIKNGTYKGFSIEGIFQNNIVNVK